MDQRGGEDENGRVLCIPQRARRKKNLTFLCLIRTCTTTILGRCTARGSGGKRCQELEIDFQTSSAADRSAMPSPMAKGSQTVPRQGPLDGRRRRKSGGAREKIRSQKVVSHCLQSSGTNRQTMSRTMA